MKKKLHQILAIEQGLRKTAQNILTETISVFKKGDHFDGLYRNYEKDNDEGIDLEPEVKPLNTTVFKKLRHTEEMMNKFIDCEFQKESANCVAKSDLIVDGVVIAKDLPATFLLFLEKTLTQLRSAYHAIPTLDPSKEWKRDENEDDVYYTKTERLRTEKQIVPIVLYHATEKHPAQVKEGVKDIEVGKWKIKIISGAIKPKDKSRLLANIDNLIMECTNARCRANDSEVAEYQISSKLFELINK